MSSFYIFSVHILASTSKTWLMTNNTFYQNLFVFHFRLFFYFTLFVYVVYLSVICFCIGFFLLLFSPTALCLTGCLRLSVFFLGLSFYHCFKYSFSGFFLVWCYVFYFYIISFYIYLSLLP